MLCVFSKLPAHLFELADPQPEQRDLIKLITETHKYT